MIDPRRLPYRHQRSVRLWSTVTHRRGSLYYCLFKLYLLLLTLVLSRFLSRSREKKTFVRLPTISLFYRCKSSRVKWPNTPAELKSRYRQSCLDFFVVPWLLVITRLVSETWADRSESVRAPCYLSASVVGMRFNEKELVSLSRQPSEKAAELGMRGPKKGDGNGALSHWVNPLFSSVVLKGKCGSSP